MKTFAQRSPRDMTSGKSMPVHKARGNNQIFKVYSRTPKESYGGHELAWKTTREIKLRIYTGIDSHVVPKPPASVNISTCKPGIFKGTLKCILHVPSSNTCGIKSIENEFDERRNISRRFLRIFCDERVAFQFRITWTVIRVFVQATSTKIAQFCRKFCLGQ